MDYSASVDSGKGSCFTQSCCGNCQEDMKWWKVHKSVKSDVSYAIIGLDFEVSESTGILSLSRLCQRLQPVGNFIRRSFWGGSVERQIRQPNPEREWVNNWAALILDQTILDCPWLPASYTSTEFLRGPGLLWCHARDRKGRDGGQALVIMIIHVIQVSSEEQLITAGTQSLFERFSEWMTSSGGAQGHTTFNISRWDTTSLLDQDYSIFEIHCY